jgi:hypothetical protein
MATNRRPTRQGRSSSNTACQYAIIGDTASAILYANRLLNNGITVPIDIIHEGVCRANINGISDLDFIPQNTNRILHYLQPEQVHFQTPGDIDIDDDDELVMDDQIINYYVGLGPIGDFIAAYFPPRVGPWFPHASMSRINHFLSQYTTTQPLNSVEMSLTTSLSNMLNLPQTSQVVVNRPSILNVHYVCTQFNHDVEQRQLFLDVFDKVNQASNVTIHTHVSNLQFSNGGSSNLYNITGRDATGNIALDHARVVWKTNPYTYLRLSSQGVNSKPFFSPAVYRSVIPIPNSNPNGVNLSSLDVRDDYISTHLALSVYDLNNPASSPLAWLVQIYTTPEDLSVVCPQGKYADSDTDRSLLIVEAVCTKNRRCLTYNAADREVLVTKNSNIVEDGWLQQFTQLVSQVYHLYTGLDLDTDGLSGQVSVCTAGLCQDNNFFQDFESRESPLTVMLETLGHLYGSEIYPQAGKS